jgi:hypothetical protein
MINTITEKENLEQGSWIIFPQEAADNHTNNCKEYEVTVDTKEKASEDLIEQNMKIKNSEIINKVIPITHNWEIIEKFQTISGILDSNKSSEEKIQIVVESIHWLTDRIDTEKKKNTPFYCGDRALLLNQIFEENKEKLSIEENNIALPYWHVMNIIKMDNKVYIADAGWWCFNEITDNLKIENKWKWEIMKLKMPIKLYKDNEKFYSFTTFPTTKNLWNDQVMYTTANIKVMEYYATKQLYQKARSTVWYENTKSIEDLKKFLDDVLYKKEKPYEWIIGEADVLLTFTKDKQIKMIKWQIDEGLSYDENNELLKGFEDISKEKSKNHTEYDIANRDKFLAEFYKEDMEITTALNLSEEDKKIIFEILPNMVEDEKWETLQDKMINRLINSMNNDKSILWENYKNLDVKLKKYLKALNMRSTQANSTLEKELVIAFQSEEKRKEDKIKKE